MKRKITQINPAYSTGGYAKKAKREAMKDISKSCRCNYLYNEKDLLKFVRVTS